MGLYEDILMGPFSSPDTWRLIPCFSFFFFSFHNTVTGNSRGLAFLSCD